MTGHGHNESHAELPSEQEVFDEPSRLVRMGGGRLAQLVLGSTPWAGGIGASFALEMQRRQNRRLESFLAGTIEYIEAVVGAQDVANESFVRSDDLAALVEDVLQEAARTSDAEKLMFLRNFLARGFITDLDFTAREFYSNLIRRLAGVHLAVLCSFAELQRQHSLGDLSGSIKVGDSLPLDVADSRLAAVCPDQIVLQAVCRDLAANGLLRQWGGNLNASEFVVTKTGLDLMAVLADMR